MPAAARLFSLMTHLTVTGSRFSIVRRRRFWPPAPGHSRPGATTAQSEVIESAGLAVAGLLQAVHRALVGAPMASSVAVMLPASGSASSSALESINPASVLFGTLAHLASRASRSAC